MPATAPARRPTPVVIASPRVGAKRRPRTGSAKQSRCRRHRNDEIAAARERYEALAALAPGRVGLVHGRMKAAEKDRVMAGFVDDDTDLLVATTVVNVGVNVAQANVMVVEHAERFGLAQLHQLRGSIGRGGAASTCLLLYQSPLVGVARRRLGAVRRTLLSPFRRDEAVQYLRSG